jgi:uncharacterized protein
MDKETVIEIVKEYSEEIRSFLPVKKVILFGSFARGDQKEHSDIDIAVVVEKIKGDYLDLSSKLFSVRRPIDSRIEPILFEEGYDPSGFLEEIYRTGIIVYQAA